MGSVREAERRAGIKRSGPVQRARSAHERERDKVRQQECRRRKREALAHGKTLAQEDLTRKARIKVVGGVNQRHVRRDADTILEVVSSIFARSADVQHQEAVLRAVWSNPMTTTPLPPSCRLSVQGLAEKEIMAGLVQSLSEVKNSKSRAHLVTKHTILTAAVSSMASTSDRQKARLLGVHPRNVRLAVQRRGSMESSDQIAWTLSVRKRRKDATSESVRLAVIAWWVAETRASPNRKEVVKKWISPGIRDEHHCQYLLESQA